MHSYFVIKRQGVSGSADFTLWKKKMYFQTLYKDGISWIEPHAHFMTCLHTQAPTTHTHTRTAQYGALQQGSRSSLIVNQELLHYNSCTL